MFDTSKRATELKKIRASVHTYYMQGAPANSTSGRNPSARPGTCNGSVSPVSMTAQGESLIEHRKLVNGELVITPSLEVSAEARKHSVRMELESTVD